MLRYPFGHRQAQHKLRHKVSKTQREKALCLNVLARPGSAVRAGVTLPRNPAGSCRENRRHAGARRQGRLLGAYPFFR
jgi:hypothetical protein